MSEKTKQHKKLSMVVLIACGTGIAIGTLTGSFWLGFQATGYTSAFGMLCGHFVTTEHLFDKAKDVSISKLRKSFATATLIGASIMAPLQFVGNYPAIKENLQSSVTTTSTNYEIAQKPKTSNFKFIS